MMDVLNPPRTWRDVVPSVLVVWTFIVIGAGISMVPTVKTLPFSWDDQIFEPGALSLIESLRLHRADFFEGVRESLLVMMAAQFVILLARARMTAVIADVARGRSPRDQLFAHVPAYLAVTLLKVVLVGLSAGMFLLAAGDLPPFDGTLPPLLVLRYGLVGFLTLLALGCSVIFSELLRLTLFQPSELRAKVRDAWLTMKNYGFSLLGTRALKEALSLATGYLTLSIALRPIAEGSTGAIATFVLGQALVLMNLSVEAWWLTRAARALPDYSAGELLRS